MPFYLAFSHRVIHFSTKCKKLLPYTKRLRNYILDASEDAKVECGTYTLGTFWSEVAWYYQELSKYTEALAFASLGLSICDKALATVFAGTLPLEQIRAFLPLRTELEGTRTIIACDMGDQETALFYGQKQFSFQEQMAAGQKTEDLAHACYVVGRVLIMTGQYAAAGVYLGRGAEILRALPDFNKLRLFSSSYGKGWIHYLQAEYPQAVRYWEGPLRDRVEAFGEDDGEGLPTGELLYALGNVAAKQERWYESFDYFSRALSQFQRTVGIELTSAAKMGVKLAYHYMRVGDYDSASTQLHQSLKVYDSAPHYRAPRARCHFKMNQILRYRGLVSAAEGALQMACDLRNGLVKPEEVQRPWALMDGDFDDCVVVWER